MRKLAGQMMKENNLVFTINGLEVPDPLCKAGHIKGI
jgi:hypothetical protein